MKTNNLKAKLAILAFVTMIVGSRAYEIVCHGNCSHHAHQQIAMVK